MKNTIIAVLMTSALALAVSGCASKPGQMSNRDAAAISTYMARQANNR